jgi:hypothetical protein
MIDVGEVVGIPGLREHGIPECCIPEYRVFPNAVRLAAIAVTISIFLPNPVPDSHRIAGLDIDVFAGLSVSTGVLWPILRSFRGPMH